MVLALKTGAKMIHSGCRKISSRVTALTFAGILISTFGCDTASPPAGPEGADVAVIQDEVDVPEEVQSAHMAILAEARVGADAEDRNARILRTVWLHRKPAGRNVSSRRPEEKVE